MFNPIVNLTISLGDIINFFILLSAIIAVIIQNRALKLSEKELNTKVKDLESLVKDLDKERQEREIQIEERKDEDLRLLNYASSVIGTEQENRVNMQGIFYNYFTTLNLSTVILTKTLKQFISQIYNKINQVSDKNNTESLPILYVFDKIVEANIIDTQSYEISKAFNNDIQAASKNYAEGRKEISSKIPYSKEFVEEFENLKKQFDIEIAFALKKHKDACIKLGIDYKKTYDELNNAVLSLMDNENSSK